MPATKKEKEKKHVFVTAVIACLGVFLTVLLITAFIASQQIRYQEKNDQEELQRELSHVKDRFRNILYSDLMAANAMAVIYKEYGKPHNFDSMAVQLMKHSYYVEAIQLTVDGVITEVYPKKGYDQTIGLNTKKDPMRTHEAERAREKKEIYFAGPRELRLGGTGILGKVPFMISSKLKAICTVLTTMETITAALQLDTNAREKFAYQLLKLPPSTDSAHYYLTSARPSPESPAATAEIPEGDWKLVVSYSAGYTHTDIPYVTVAMGLLVAFLAASLTYRATNQPYELRNIISEKTRQLASREEYYRTLIQTSSDAVVLTDEKGRVLYQTPSTQRISGYSLAEIQGLDGKELVHPDDREATAKAFQELVNKPGGQVPAKLRLKKKNGDFIWIEGTYRNLLEEESVRAVVFSYTDITQRVESAHKIFQANRMLKERIKELSTIYQVNAILQNKEQPNRTTFFRILEMLPKGMQYPENCEARIDFDGETYASSGYAASSQSLLAEFQLDDGREGCIEVVYNGQQEGAFEASFMKEERELLNNLAEVLRVYLNKKSQEQSLSRSEARFRGAFEYSAIGMTLVSLNGAFMKVNKAFCEMTGYPEEELLNLTFREITHPEDVGNDQAFIRNALSGTSDNYRVEKRYITKSKAIVWGNLNVTLIRDAAGSPAYFVGQIENITARRESELKFRNLVEKSIVGVYIIQDGKFAYVNPWVTETFQFTAEEFANTPVTDFVHPDDVETVKRNIESRMANRTEAMSYELRALKKSGEVLWLEVFGSVTLFEGKPAIIGTIVDVTEKKAAHDELVKSEANLKAILENTRVSFLLLDSKYNVLATNQYFFDNYLTETGYKLHNGSNFVELTLPERTESIRKNFATVLATRQPVSYETAYTNTGTTKYLHITISPVLSGGAVIGYTIASIDITQRKNMENERQNMLSELIIRNKKMEEFAAIVSHNLRGPVAGILGLTNLFREGLSDSDEKSIINGIRTSAENLDEVVKEMNRILHYQEKFSEQKTTVDLNALIEEVKVSLRNTIAATHATIECDFSAVTHLSTIHSFLQNIIYNLMANSLQFRQPDQEPHIRIRSEKVPDGVILHFQDNSLGIDMEKYGSQVFGLNKRFHPTISGKGLGLFMVKAQAEGLHGNIEVSSKPNEGATFKITLPD